MTSLDSVLLRSDTCKREGYRDKQQHRSVSIFHFSGKFAIQRPNSNAFFALRIQEDIMSDFWHRVRRGRFSISIAFTKLDFNVDAVSACICKQCHGRRKEVDHLPQNLKDFKGFP